MITFKKFQPKDFSHCFVATDRKISALYGVEGDNVFFLPRGERAKDLRYVGQLCSWLVSRGAQRDDVLVAVGGGSVGDVTGFVASVYKRGMKFLNVPTTFLAQIDSGIGGKTAVDLDGVKNAVGTFVEGDTLIDVDFLSTLPRTQWKNGFGELLKYRMLDSAIDKAACGKDIAEIVRTCANFKQRVCERDPFDKNERRVLNFGHTIGHAMELFYGISHGEAVTNGIFYETLLAFRLGLVDKDYLQRWQAEAVRLFAIHELTPQILCLTLHDKKNYDGQICFVLPTAEGFCQRQISFRQLTELL